MTVLGCLMLTFSLLILLTINQVFMAIDINLPEFQYIAIHLDPYECRRLVAALHYTSLDLPKDISGATRKVSKDIPCLAHLLHWNNSPTGGRGKIHTEVERRLRQLNHNDLADWLGKMVFQKLGDDMLQSINKPFGEFRETKNEIPYLTTTDVPTEESDDMWHTFDQYILLSLCILFICLIIMLIALIIHNIKQCWLRKRTQQNESFFPKSSTACRESTCVNRRNLINEKMDKQKNYNQSEARDKIKFDQKCTVFKYSNDSEEPDTSPELDDINTDEDTKLSDSETDVITSSTNTFE